MSRKAVLNLFNGLMLSILLGSNVVQGNPFEWVADAGTAVANGADNAGRAVDNALAGAADHAGRAADAVGDVAKGYLAPGNYPSIRPTELPEHIVKNLWDVMANVSGLSYQQACTLIDLSNNTACIYAACLYQYRNTRDGGIIDTTCKQKSNYTGSYTMMFVASLAPSMYQPSVVSIMLVLGFCLVFIPMFLPLPES